MYIVQQSSVLGPLQLNIDLIDLFLECEDNSYADDTTPYILVQKICLLSFENYNMKANPGKSHISLSFNTQPVVSFDNVQVT